MAKREFVVGSPVAIWGDPNVRCGPYTAVPVTKSGLPGLQRSYKKWVGTEGTVYRLVRVTPAEVKAKRERRAGKRKE